VLRKLQRKESTQGLVVITTYEGLRKYRLALVNVEWTAVCLDEGQKIRNPAAQITNTCKMLPAFHRVILSGTPIQNSLRELWSLFDFIYPGRLGSLPVFEQEFANPIRTGGYASANVLQYEIAIRCASTLQKIVKPYLLRRKKDDLITVTKLPPKTEQVLFCQISPRQREIYLNILDSDEVRAVMQRRMMAFRAINTLRKLCNHPALVFQQGKVVWQQDPLQEKRNTAPGGVSAGSLEDGEEAVDDDDGDVALLSKVGSNGLVWADSGKLLVLSKLLPLWYTEGHKVLIFSQTRGMLGIIESMVRELGFLYLRLDGSTPVGKRAGLVNQYNTNPKIFVMLLTTRTGGVGISLTAANRVVLYDPDWNPMTDMQSRERAWRLGQKREVTVYRLITRGTIEEKIYQRQIFKLLLSNRILENAKQKALFAESHIRELFELNDGFSKGGQDRFGHQVGAEALPKGGEIDMRQPAAADVAATPLAEPAATAGATVVEPAVASLEDIGQVEVADHVPEEPLPVEVTDAIEMCEAPAADGSNSRDRRLLQALFAGDAITSVYDHHYFDPTTNRGDDKAKVDPALAEARLRKAAERVAVRAEATTAVNRAINELQLSSRVYQGPMPRIEEAPYLPTEQQQFNNHTYETEAPSFTQAPGGPRPRFGGSSSSLFGTSSAALLAGLAQDAPATVVRSSSASRPWSSSSATSAPPLRVRTSSTASSSAPNQSPALPRSHSQQQLSTASTVSTPNPFGTTGSGTARASVKDDIAVRLRTLFDQADRPLTTAFVLSRFKDLGDQYAPLFRDLLRSVAKHRDGTWSKK
jgi:DNA excision repair protein ERCC-6